MVCRPGTNDPEDAPTGAHSPRPVSKTARRLWLCKKGTMEQIATHNTPSGSGKHIWEPLLTPIEAAQMLRIHPKTALRLARAHSLPAIRLGKHWRFRQCDLTAWAEQSIVPLSQPSECQEY
jgi:excisionase family DNA binding protein